MSNGVVQEYDYDPGNQSTQALTDSRVWDASGSTLFDRHYEWDAAGNLTHWEDKPTAGAQGEAWDCEYDGIGTLLGCSNRAQPEWFDYMRLSTVFRPETPDRLSARSGRLMCDVPCMSSGFRGVQAVRAALRA